MVNYGQEFIPKKISIEEAINQLQSEAGNTAEVIAKLLDIIEYQEERISALYDIVYDLAPEYEIIDTMADSKEEKMQLLNKYMNLNDRYAAD